MDKRCRSGLGVGLLLLAAGIALAMWYVRMEEGQRRHLLNLLRQAPALPGRYMV
jgi:predicted outer membrane lipoprotein